MKLLIRNSFYLKLVILLSICIPLSCKKIDRYYDPKQESAEVVFQWYKFMTTLQRPISPQPLVFNQARAFAYVGIGLFESVQPGIKGGSSFSSKLYQMPAMPKIEHSKKYLWSASANAALASMFKQLLVTLSDADKASIDAHELAIYNKLKLVASEDVLKRSEAFGRSIANAIYNWSTTDNYSVSTGLYTPINEPWAWAPTPPALAPALGDGLQNSRPFLRYTLNSTVPDIPVQYSEDPSSAFYMAAVEVYNLGGTTSASDENKATASWWADAGGVGVGVPAPYHLLSCVTSVLENKKAGLWKAAEIYAKTGIVLKDGPIHTFRAKYKYNFLRPITFIRRKIDGTWLSHLANPPYPEYPSGLVGLFGPLVQILINEYGDIPAVDDSYAWRGLPARQFTKLSLLRKQASDSRIYAGIHYRFTQDASIGIAIELGNQIDKIQVVGPDNK